MISKVSCSRAGGVVWLCVLAVGHVAIAAENELTTTVSLKIGSYENYSYDPNGNEQHITQADIAGLISTYGQTGQSDARGSVHTSMGVRVSVTDPNIDGSSIRGSALVRSLLAFHVDTPGTIHIPIVADGWLMIPDSPADAGGSFEASGGVQVYIQKLDPQWDTWYILNGADQIDCRPKKVWSTNYNPRLLTGTYGFEAGEAIVDSRSISWSLDRVVSATITEPGDYSVLIKSGAYAQAYAGTDIAGTATYDAYNTVGFGGNFWDVVSGSATFHEIDNPANRYVPEPTTSALLVLATSLAIVRRRRATHKP